MATTLNLISKQTLGAAASSVTFSNIPQTYTDLKILVSARDDRSGQPNTDLSVQVGLNGTINTGSIYSARQLYGSGSTAGSQSSATTYMYVGMATGPTSTSNTFGSTEIYIPNYTSSNNKTVSVSGVSENNAVVAYAVLNAGLISTSNAITDVKISAVYGSGNYQSGSTFYLYGVSSSTTQNTSVPKALGGDTITTNGTYWYHTFLSSGTFRPLTSLTCDYLVVAGGGGGGGASNGPGAGGGGAGGLRCTVGATGGGGSLESALSLTAQAYTVTVGAGGNGAGGEGANGSNGSNSVFSTITSTGGGGGGGASGGGGLSGNSGGSGGGAGSWGGGGSGGSGTANQGYAGGQPGTSFDGAGGGGGGAGAVGGNGASNGVAGNGGAGVTTSISGSAVTYAGGGGGQGQNGNGSGGSSIGGSGGQPGSAGVANTGSGGGGSKQSAGANGASGIVIVRYAV